MCRKSSTRYFEKLFFFVFTNKSRDDSISVSLENIQIDVQDLTRGLDNAKKELVIRQTMMNVDTHSLESFIQLAQDRIDRLIQDAKLAQDSFNQCVEYFGETPRTQNPSNFFSVFVKFHRAYQVCCCCFSFKLIICFRFSKRNSIMMNERV